MFDYDLRNLPVGFKFEPTNQEIVKSYVRPAIEKGRLPNFMIHCDVYTEEPWKMFDENFAGWFWVYTPPKHKSTISGQNQNKNKKKKKKKKNNPNPSKNKKKEYFHRRAGCGWWDGRTEAKEIRDCDGNLLGHRKYLIYRKNDDPKGSSGWVMHEYSAADQGLNTTAAICKIQFKASSAKINNKRQGDQTQMSVNPTPHKKPRVEDKGSHSHDHDHDQTKGDGDCYDDSDDIDVYAGYLDAILLEKEKENPPSSLETQEEDCFRQLVPNEADTNPSNEEATLCTSQTFDIDWNGLALAVIEPLDNLGSNQFNGGFDHQFIIPTGFEFDDFCTKHNLLFC